jgi:hypothetical protein
MTHPSPVVVVTYRFLCRACGFKRETRERNADQYCPLCRYPRDAAGHIYRDEPEDGAELDA